jgi:hypothetical protein
MIPSSVLYTGVKKVNTKRVAVYGKQRIPENIADRHRSYYIHLFSLQILRIDTVVTTSICLVCKYELHHGRYGKDAIPPCISILHQSCTNSRRNIYRTVLIVSTFHHKMPHNHAVSAERVPVRFNAHAHSGIFPKCHRLLQTLVERHVLNFRPSCASIAQRSG